jgi:hypothetical protein
MKFATLALAAAFALVATLPVSAAATHGTSGRDSGKTSTSSRDSGANPFNPNCRPVATHAIRCEPPRKVGSAAKDCYCNEVKVRTKAGTVVRKVRCSEFRIADILQVRVVTDSCETIRRMPRVVK